MEQFSEISSSAEPPGPFLSQHSQTQPSLYNRVQLVWFCSRDVDKATDFEAQIKGRTHFVLKRSLFTPFLLQLC